MNLKNLTSFPIVIALTAAMLNTNVSQAAEREPVRGVVKSGKEAVVSVEFNARVISTPVKAGEAFSEGDTLVEFDCEALNAERNAARAAYGAARSVHKNNLELQKYGAIGELEVGVSEAEMQQALASAEAIKARTKDCVISAPFSGRVAELAINTFETPGVNQPLMKIVGSNDLELRLIVPSNWLSWLKIGESFSFQVDETGQQHVAQVTQVGAEVDAVSRTVPITAKFEAHPSTVLPGMSGTAVFVDSAS